MIRLGMLGVVCLGVGCKRPPVAPEGLDASARALVRTFYEDDATVGATLTGLTNWVDGDGAELLGEGATLDNVGSFQLADLAEEDVAALELEGARDLTAAAGVVALGEMGCRWQDVEALYVRGDQDVVFEGDFDAYVRSFESSRDAYEKATASSTFSEVDAPLEPMGADQEDVLLRTRNDVTQTLIGITIRADLVLHLRHGIFEIQGEERAASLVLGYVPKESPGDDGTNSLVQSYTAVALIEQGDRTLRLFAIWNQLDSPWVQPDSATVLSASVNKAQDAAERLTEICSGETSIANEPR